MSGDEPRLGRQCRQQLWLRAPSQACSSLVSHVHHLGWHHGDTAERGAGAPGALAQLGRGKEPVRWPGGAG